MKVLLDCAVWRNSDYTTILTYLSLVRWHTTCGKLFLQ